MKNNKIKYVGFWERTLASTIDSVLSLLIAAPILTSLYGRDYLDNKLIGIASGPVNILMTWVLPAVAVIAFWVFKQATPGKMAISARIVDARTGNPATTRQLVGRYFAYFVAAMPLFLGILWVALDKRKQGWHDKLAGTVVVKVGTSTGWRGCNDNQSDEY